MSILNTDNEQNLLDQIDALRARVAEQDEQIAALQAKVHLCAGYGRLEKRVKELEVALEWIRDGCDVPGECKCGRPNGIPAIRAHAIRALAGKENTREED